LLCCKNVQFFFPASTPGLHTASPRPKPKCEFTNNFPYSRNTSPIFFLTHGTSRL
jgi:hypothetical protein